MAVMIVLFAAPVLIINLIFHELMENQHEAKVSLGHIQAMITQVDALYQAANSTNVRSSASIRSTGPLMDPLREELVRWNRSEPYAASEAVKRVSSAVDRLITANKRLLDYLESRERADLERLLRDEAMPALDAAESIVFATADLLEERTQSLDFWHNLADAITLSASVLILALLFWRLDGAQRRSDRLETERRELESRDRHIQAVLRNMVDAVIILSADGQIREASTGLLRVVGMPAELVRGRLALTLIHPSEQDAFALLLEQVRGAAGLEMRAEMRVGPAGGPNRTAEVVATNLLHDPEIEGFLLQLRDVTDRRQAEQAARESEHRLRSTLNQLPAILWIVDRRLTVTEAVGSGLRVLGLDSESVRGRSVCELIPDPAVRTRYLELFWHAMEGQAGEQEDHHFMGRVFQTYAEPLRGRDGEVVGVVNITRDTTDSWEAERALREKDRLHRLVTENSVDIVALYDPEGNTTYVSPAVEVILGYTPAEYIAAAVEEMVHPADLDALSESRRRGSAGEQVRIAFRIRQKNGPYIWFETLTRPVHDDQGELVAVVASSRDITERKVFEQQLELLAYHDQLTGLLNQVGFARVLTERLARADAEGTAVLIVDVDSARVVNETLGQRAGDELLSQFALDLSVAASPGSITARLGGDEFGVLLEGVGTPEQGMQVCRSIAAELDAPISVRGREMAVSISLGMALATRGSDQADDLIREAKVALRRGKREGTGPVVYDPSMSENAVERLELDAELRRALRQGSLMVYHQPIISLRDGTVEGTEALVRWHHPVKGWIPPNLFIPIAEQAGYVDQLGRWVLEQACRDAVSWIEQGLVPERFSVSVNLSPVQFQRVPLADEIAAVLRETGLAPQRLTLELTESTLMQNPAVARTVLQGLKALGIRIAIDDFGTGHSSLSYLKEFPLDILKIDRSFVSGLGRNLVDRALARAVISLAQALDMAVTAEGVESREQLTELGELGCDRAQGYFFARPAPAEEIAALLTDREPTWLH